MGSHGAAWQCVPWSSGIGEALGSVPGFMSPDSPVIIATHSCRGRHASLRTCQKQTARHLPGPGHS